MRRDPARLGQGLVDLLVVGGGVYGAWIAYDAALRGLSVSLVERDDWGSGTSSASSKLIHGGLRYLEYGQFGLVAKALRERARLLRLGPHRVWPLRFLLPVQGDSRAGRGALVAGLLLYDLLAGPRPGLARHRHHARDELVRSAPWLEQRDLRGGFTYGDAGTDDARLTLELVAGAQAAGALAVNHAAATTLRQDAGGAVGGALVRDGLGGREHEVRARLTVVAAGPWASRLAGCAPGPLRLSKGVHLVLPPLPGAGDRALLLTTTSDRRVFFLIPWYGATLLGTTDEDYQGDPERVRVEEADVAYLLGQAQARCPGLGWTRADIRGSFAGLRTLQAGRHGQVGAATREWTLVEPGPGVLVPVGGKLTSARVEAARTVDRCLALLGRPALQSTTGQRRLPWAPPAPWPSWSASQAAVGIGLGLDPATAATCVRRYGRTVAQLWTRLAAHPGHARRIDPRHPFCLGEIGHAIGHEMACSAADVLRRRIPLEILGGAGAAVQAEVAAALQRKGFN